jgi:hypothetical protein
MHRETRGFIDHKEILVLKEDLKGHLKRGHMGRLFSERSDFNRITGAHLQSGLRNDLSVNGDEPLLYPALYLRTAAWHAAREIRDQYFIEAFLFSIILKSHYFTIHTAKLFFASAMS